MERELGYGWWLLAYYRCQVSGVRCQQTDDGLKNLMVPAVIGFAILTPEN
jgi:hypothetical protein